MSYLPLLVSLLFLTVFTWLAIVCVMAFVRARPPRLNSIKALYLLGRLTPADLGFAYEPMTFQVRRSRSNLSLKAWLVRHPDAGGRTVVLLHGFADAKIGAAAWLGVLHACRWNALLLDLPAHGESDGSVATAGIYEAGELQQVIADLRQRVPECCQRIVLFGISMGAAVASAAVLSVPEIAGLIMDSPYSEFRKAAIRHAWLFGLPGAMFQAPATWLSERFFGRSYRNVAPIRTLPQAPCPVLLIQAGDDVLISRRDMRCMHELVAARGSRDGKSAALTILAAPHILGLARDPEGYGHAVADFLARL